MNSIKDVKVFEFDKHLKKARGHIGRNVVEITIKMKAIVRKPLMIKMNFDVLNISVVDKFYLFLLFNWFNMSVHNVDYYLFVSFVVFVHLIPVI